MLFLIETKERLRNCLEIKKKEKKKRKNCLHVGSQVTVSSLVKLTMITATWLDPLPLPCDRFKHNVIEKKKEKKTNKTDNFNSREKKQDKSNLQRANRTLFLVCLVKRRIARRNYLANGVRGKRSKTDNRRNWDCLQKDSKFSSVPVYCTITTIVYAPRIQIYRNHQNKRARGNIMEQ